MHSFERIRKEYTILLRSIPSMVTAAFVLSVVLMNLLASRELYRSDYFCLNCGLALSWVSFLCMDCVCRRFGAKAAARLSIFAMSVNILCAVLFWLLMRTPGRWAAYYSANDPAVGEMINAAVDSTFAGAWYVVAGSSVALAASSLVNAFTNQWIGERSDNGRFFGFALRSLGSTCLAQFVDNFVFSALVSHVFFGWTWPQVLICSLTSMLIELAFEAVFSPLGYKVSQSWEKENVGAAYLSHLKKAHAGGNA